LKDDAIVENDRITIEIMQVMVNKASILMMAAKSGRWGMEP
jgi:hypothetical protein